VVRATVLEEPAAQDDKSRGEHKLRVQLSASARGATGLLPHSPALGIQAQLELRRSPFYAAGGVSYWPSSEQRSATYPSATLRGSGLFSELSLGVDLSGGPLRVATALCAELGELRADALGIQQPRPTRVLWAAAGASGLAALRLLGSWNLALELGGLIPIFRTHWLVQGPQGDVAAYVAAAVGLRVGLRLGYTFW
jgi:hypothetical protein